MKRLHFVLYFTFVLVHAGNLQQIITKSSSTIPVVASGSYRFTNVSTELAYVFQLPKNFSYFSIKAEVKVPDPSWFYEKSYQSKLLFYESSVPYIYTGPGKTYVLKIYNDPARVSNDSFSTTKEGWYLIVQFMPSYNFVISGDLLNLTVTAANVPNKNGGCPKDTFHCTPSAALCLTNNVLRDGVRNCENGYDEAEPTAPHNDLRNCENGYPKIPPEKKTLSAVIIVVIIVISIAIIIGLVLILVVMYRKRGKKRNDVNARPDTEMQKPLTASDEVCFPRNPISECNQLVLVSHFSERYCVDRRDILRVPATVYV